MKKILTSVFIIGSFLIYALVYHQNTDANLVPSTTDTTATSTQSTDSSNNNSMPMMSSMPMMGNKYKDGEYIGPAVDAFYGNIQVKAIISGGKLTDVQFLQYPNDQEESRQINGMAMPILRSEAIAAQSGNVDLATRATDSSMAFRQSLNAALAQAQQ